MQDLCHQPYQSLFRLKAFGIGQAGDRTRCSGVGLGVLMGP